MTRLDPSPPPAHDPPAVYYWRRHVKVKRRGADLHAFEPEGGDGEGDLSLCGMVRRGSTAVGIGVNLPPGDPRGCRICWRVARGHAPLYYGHSPSTLPAAGQTSRTLDIDKALETARALVVHAEAWEPGARLVGNLTAAELAAQARAFITLADRRPR